MCSINLRALDDTRLCECHDHPVVARSSTACRLPAITHIHTATRYVEILHAAIMLIAAGDRTTAIFNCEQIDEAFDVAEIGANLAEYSKSCDTTVWIDVQTYMRPDALVANFKIVVRVAGEVRFHK